MATTPSTAVDLPEHLTMRVRVVSRGTGRSYEGVRIHTVTIQNRCPKCLGPRGEATPYRFCEDGAWYTCDRWDNPCGHVDMYGDVLAEAQQLIKNSTPRFETCDPPGMNSHQLGRGFGHEWCECDHTAVVEQRDPLHDGIDADRPPVWWHRALREALAAAENPSFDFATAWAHLRILARDLAADGTCERWDEFAPRVMELDQARAEELLRLLDAAGIASVVAAVWDYRDGKGRRHGKDCGCLLIDIGLVAEQPRAETRCPECAGLGGGHGFVHVRHETGGGGFNRPCSRALQQGA